MSSQMNRFPTSMVLYKDTRKCENITVRNIELRADDNGIIEGPADLKDEISPHGFIPVDAAWLSTLTAADRVRLAKIYPQHIERFVSREDRERAKS